ncbi:translation initiation factor eIF-2B subunit alpha [Trichodelitschia bisporula]|uniref:Translation initiation factor eIF2B subunit alpha n=1 Tax=Trichodelitschia bisporula TaxID=703511 RepID=A0A6G1HKT5_9PEZI|nr:translation initiation factor eIF-2B subunit alpha [Trichodelitschia bisporula]
MSTETPAEQILTPEAVDDSSFDVVETYRNLLAMDPDLTMPVAAIESLVLGLAAHPTTTISETLDLLRDLSQRLAESTPNPISLSAGTDLFQRYLIMSLRPGNVPLASKKGTKKLPATDDFTTIRAHLLKHGRSFVANAKAARARIASFGRNLMKEGCTVLTTGGSRVVAALLREAAEGGVRFRVVYVLPPPRPGRPQSEGLDLVKDLRERGVPVATVSEGAVGYSLAGGVGGGKVDMVIVGAEGVVENGGIISRLGTCQIGMLAKAAHRPFYVVAESHKFVRMFPLSQGDLGIEQRIVDFRTDEPNPWDMTPDPVDFTSPEYISGIITEAGILTPSAVSEELIKIWF